MTATHGEGVYGNAVGVTTPLEHKLAQVAEFVKTTTPNLIRPGVLYNGDANLVVGKPNMSYDVKAATFVSTRGASAGAVKFANDGVFNVVTTPAPGSNSRIDIVYAWHREYALDGGDSNPIIGVIQGTAAASPTAPSLAAFTGAIELARITVAAGATATNGAGVTITQTAPFTAVDGGKVEFRSTTEMNLWTTAMVDQLAIDLSALVTYRWSGSAWKAWESDWMAFTITPVSGFVLGTGSVTNVGKYRYEAGMVRCHFYLVLGTTGSSLTGVPTMNLPVPSIAPDTRQPSFPGDATFFDTSVNGSYFCKPVPVDSSTSQFRLVIPGTNGIFTGSANNIPFTWAAGDAMQGEFVYTPA